MDDCFYVDDPREHAEVVVFQAELSQSLLSYAKRFALTIVSDFDPSNSRRLVSWSTIHLLLKCDLLSRSRALCSKLSRIYSSTTTSPLHDVSSYSVEGLTSLWTSSRPNAVWTSTWWRRET